MLSVKKLLYKINQYIRGDNDWTALNNSVRYAKRGGIVYVSFYNGGSIALIKAGVSLGTMPEGYRPFSQIDFAGTALGGAETVFFRIGAGGAITGYASASTTYWSGLICYPVKIVG